MKPEALKTAINEAKRFLERSSRVNTHTWEDYAGKKHTIVQQGQDSAALRRASLDLTRALAQLRKP